MATISALCCGLLFGFGLLLSGMANPAKVLGFLDLRAGWDPSLALVMLGAIAVAAIGFRLVKGRTQSLLGNAMQLPKKTSLDRPLIMGSMLFGLGWGFAGYCPGPAIVSLGLFSLKASVFVAAMLLGMIGYKVYAKFTLR